MLRNIARQPIAFGISVFLIEAVVILGVLQNSGVHVYFGGVATGILAIASASD